MRGFVERALLEDARLAQKLFHIFVARFGEIHRALLLVEIVMLLAEARDQQVDLIVKVGLVVGRSRNDQRRARLVDQDRVDLVDDRIGVPTLHHLRELVFHVIAQIVETVFVVGAVGDVAGISRLALLVVEAVHDDADAHPEELVDLPHPLGIAAGEVIVDSDDVHAVAGKRVQIDGERRDERLAFAGSHLGDRAFVQHHAADELHVKMALAERALCRLAHGGKGRHEDVVEALALGELGLEGIGAGGELVVRELLDFRLKRVDRGDFWRVALQPPVIGAAENLFGESAQHLNENLSGRRGAQPARAFCRGPAAKLGAARQRLRRSAAESENRSADKDMRSRAGCHSGYCGQR